MEIAVKPRLSVIVASHNARASVSACLVEIQNQCEGNTIEIVVIDNSVDGTDEIISRQFSDIKLISAPKNYFIPQLWGLGITESTGEIIALTTTHFVPAKNWISEILKIHESPFSGVGGAIENDEQAGIISWAVYFCRYSQFMLPFTQVNIDELAADNASYKRRDLERVKETLVDGFWEVFVHQAMQKAKMTLLLTPEIVVFHQDSFTFSDFMRQRFLHGIQFGNSRAKNITTARRIALILLSPLIPLLYLYRISQRVLSKKRNIGKYLKSLPILFLFLLSWSVGECYGYLRKLK